MSTLIGTSTTAAELAADVAGPTQGQDSPAAWDKLAAGFDAYVTPSGIGIGEVPLATIGLGPDHRFLDVAAGSGALSIAAAKRGADVTAIDFSPAMIDRLERRAQDAGLDNIRARVMDGTDLGFDNDSFDVSGSQFGVMLFPDYALGLRELVRVTRPGGWVVLITMGPPEQVEFLTTFAGAIKSAVPEFDGLPNDPPPLPLRLADPARVRQVMAEAGLSDVDVERRSYAVEHDSAEHLWNWVVHSNPVGAMMSARVPPDRKPAVLGSLRKMLSQRARNDGPAVLHNAVNVGIGRV